MVKTFMEIIFDASNFCRFQNGQKNFDGSLEYTAAH